MPYAGDENVEEAVVIVIADGHAHSVHLDVEACAARHVRESAVAVVTIELQSGSLTFARTGRSECVTRPVHAVHKKDVLPAIAVVVEKRAARAQRFRKQLAAVCATI